uniref:Uncharacterized protein n=1 Tax=Oryza barthii TaxID=65489 RepID=A0A0D3HB82_9ORYZ
MTAAEALEHRWFAEEPKKAEVAWNACRILYTSPEYTIHQPQVMSNQENKIFYKGKMGSRD